MVWDLTAYAGRRIDVLAFRGGRADPGDVRLEMRLAGVGDPGEACTGVQKLAQRFFVNVLTDRGSDPADPDRGTDLMAQIRGGAVRSSGQLIGLFAAAAAETAAWMRRSELDTDPDDERLGGAEASSAAVERGRLSITVRLSTVAGTATTFILPIPFPIA